MDFELDQEFEMVRVELPRCMLGLDSTKTHNKYIGYLDTMEDEVENPSPQSTPQILPSFEVYIPPMTCPKEVEETIGIPIEVEPLDQTQLENIGLNTCSYNLSLISKEVLNFDEPEP